MLAMPLQTTEAPITSGTDTAEGHDGTPLFYRWWLPTPNPKRALVLFHGGHEHSGRFDELVATLSRSLPRRRC
jgi:alpha-beta hydrolase superfamily lysophospholipase